MNKRLTSLVSAGLLGAGLTGCVATMRMEDALKMPVRVLAPGIAARPGTEGTTIHDTYVEGKHVRQYVREDGTIALTEELYTPNKQINKERESRVDNLRARFIGQSFGIKGKDSELYMGVVQGFVDRPEDRKKYDFLWTDPQGKVTMGLSPVRQEDFVTFVWTDKNSNGEPDDGEAVVSNQARSTDIIGLRERIGAVASDKTTKIDIYNSQNNLIYSTGEEFTRTGNVFNKFFPLANHRIEVGETITLKVLIDNKEYIERKIEIKQ